MPELPEVETTIRGIAPYLQGSKIDSVVVRQRQLRWPIVDGLEQRVKGMTITKLERRGKYIVVHLSQGGIIIHLGMSGSLRVLLKSRMPGKHDHFDIVNTLGQIVRYHDPRKFGSLLYCQDNPLQHPRLIGLGVEPLTPEYHAGYLYACAVKKTVPIKSFLMDSRIAVGVGNIYASEALFLAGIHPLRKCSRISLSRYDLLVSMVKDVLEKAIEQGGTTLKDFVAADGSPGYFTQTLSVYGREGLACFNCGSDIQKVVISQRSTFYCKRCQH